MNQTGPGGSRPPLHIRRGHPQEAIEAKNLGSHLRRRRRRRRVKRQATVAVIVLIVVMVTPRVIDALQDSRTFPALYCSEVGITSDGTGWADWVVARFGGLLDSIGICSEYELPPPS